MLKLTRINNNGNKVECIITPENIDGMGEFEIPDEPLFDVDGNRVDIKHNENLWKIHFNTGAEIFVEKATYDKLCKKLKVENLD